MSGKRNPVGTSSFGVLLSGPNGTGKSAVGVETALTCFARGMISIYISSASEWVAAAKRGKGDGFLLERLLRQNADLIAAQPALRKALAPALVLEPDAVGETDATAAGSIMKVLCNVLAANPSLNVGLIVDEVQTITNVKLAALKEPIPANFIANAYFESWYNWDNENRFFVRMDIASSHGARELKLPSGDEHRLRIIKPWSEELVTALTTCEGSPCAFPKAHESARKRIIFTTGGIPRSLLRGKWLLEEALAAYDNLSASKKKDVGSRLPWATRNVEDDLRVAMEENCSRWFHTLTADEKCAASSTMLQLVRGEVNWTRFKGLYDDGLVARGDNTSSHVTPVSAVASSVIMTVLTGHYLEAVRKPLRSIAAGAERGIALELQVIACLAKVGTEWLPAMTLNGKGSAPKVLARADERLPFNNVDDLEASEALARLYVPVSKSFACDAITIPSSASVPESAPIVVWEMSVTSPRDAKRIDKVLKWFGTRGIVTALRAAHPGRPIVCALCWPEKLDAADPQALRYLELMLAADAASKQSTTKVSVAVVDMTGLQTLGVLL
jgi:hypothetical protein